MPVAMVVWPALLVGTGVAPGQSLIASLIAGSFIAVPNVTFGVALQQLAVRLWRWAHHRESPTVMTSVDAEAREPRVA